MIRGVLRTGTLPTHRIEAFSDGIFAVVATLLVLEVKVPELHGAAAFQMNALSQALLAVGPKFISYVISFVVVIIFWVSHHSLFHLLEKSDRGVLWLNGLFLLCLTFIPFPTALIGEYTHNRGATLFYGLAMACIGGSVTLLRWYCTRSDQLLKPGLNPELLRGALRKSWLSPTLYCLGGLISLLSIRAALVVFILIPFLFFLPNRLEKHQKQKEAPDLI